MLDTVPDEDFVPTFRKRTFFRDPFHVGDVLLAPGRRAAPVFSLMSLMTGGPHDSQFYANGRPRTVDIEPETLVVDLLRENLNLKGPCRVRYRSVRCVCS